MISINKFIFFASSILLALICLVTNVYKLDVVEVFSIGVIILWMPFLMRSRSTLVFRLFLATFWLMLILDVTAILQGHPPYFVFRQSLFLLYLMTGLVLFDIFKNIDTKTRVMTIWVIYFISAVNVAVSVTMDIYPSFSALLCLLSFSPIFWLCGGIRSKAAAVVGLLGAVIGSHHVSYVLAALEMVSLLAISALANVRPRRLIYAALALNFVGIVGAMTYILTVQTPNRPDDFLRYILYTRTFHDNTWFQTLIGRGVGIPYVGDYTAYYVLRQLGPAQENFYYESMTLTLHSTLMTIFFHIGLLGVGAYVAALAVMADLGRLLRQRVNRFALGVTIGAIGALVHAAFNQFMEAPYHAFPFYYLVALGSFPAAGLLRRLRPAAKVAKSRPLASPQMRPVAPAFDGR